MAPKGKKSSVLNKLGLQIRDSWNSTIQSSGSKLGESQNSSISGPKVHTENETMQISGSSNLRHRRHIDTASEVAKTCLRALKESSDVFPPLKSVVGGISFFIDNHEQWEANKDSLQRLTERISQLTEQQVTNRELSVAEKGRREDLERKFEQIAKDLDDLKTGNRVLRYIMTKDNSTILSGIVENINTVIIDYQLSLQHDVYNQILRLIDIADMGVLDRLLRAKDAGYRSRDPDSGCLSGTRISILNTLEIWANNKDPRGQHVYWLNGHAGSGKSTIAHSFCQRLYASGQLGASFFCSRNFLERSDIKLIFPTIAFQLACGYPNFCTHLVTTLKKCPDLGSESMITQLTELLVKPLQESGIKTTISIDALDECRDQEPTSTVVALLARVIDQIPLVKFFITGRPETSIRAGFRIPTLKPYTEIIILHEIEESNVDHDISLYINTKLRELVQSHSGLDVSQVWPSEDQVRILVAKSAKFFIFASTCIRMISSPPPSDPVQVLEKLTDSGSTSLEGMSGIDHLYAHVLLKIFSPSAINIQAELRLILSAIVLLYNPLSCGSLSDLLQIPQSRLSTRISSLHSLLLVPCSGSDPVRVHHKSLPDYLTDRQRCIHDPFYIDPTIYHAEIAIACLDFMKKHLRKNICLLPRYVMNSVMPLADRRKYIGATLEYACRFWAQHVCEAARNAEHANRLLPVVCEFLQQRQILWFEVLSLLDDIHKSVSSLQMLEKWIQKNTHVDNILALHCLQDGLLFVLRFLHCIELSAQHLYHSGLPLAPTSSVLRNANVYDLASEGTLIRGSNHWDTRRALRLGTTGIIYSLAVSHDGDLLAATNNEHIEVFNVLTGKCLYTLKSNSYHDDNINSLIHFISEDSMILVGRGTKVEVWDLQTGCVIHSFHRLETGLYNDFQSVDMSLDRRYVASGDGAGNIYVWDMASGTLVYNFDTWVGIKFISFSSSSNSLIICSEDIIERKSFLEEVINPTSNRDEFECSHGFDFFVISTDRSLLAARDSSDRSRISLYDTRTGRVIWKHRFDEEALVLSVLPHEHSLRVMTKSAFEIKDYTASPTSTRLRLAHGIPKFRLDRTVITWDGNCVAYVDEYLTDTFVRHLQYDQPTGSSGSSMDKFYFRATADGAMGVVWHRNTKEIHVCGAHSDVILTSPARFDFLRHCSLTPNKKFIAIVGRFKKRNLIVQFWDLTQASLAWAVYLREESYFLVEHFQFVDDNTYIISVPPPYTTASTSFGLSELQADKNHIKSVSGVTGSSWDLFLPYSETAQLAYLLETKMTELRGLQTYHLDVTGYIAPDPCPHYVAHSLDEGWLRDDSGNKILWVPHDSRPLSGIGWGTGKTFVTGGASGVVTAMDFSNIHGIEMYDSTLSQTKNRERLVEYVKNLSEMPSLLGGFGKLHTMKR